AETLQLLLRLLGHETRQAYTGPEALAVAAEVRPDLVLLDLGLPGLNGFEVARRLRGGGAHAGGVLGAPTGWGRDAGRRRSREAGFDHHLVKPVDPEALRQLLAALASAR